MAYVGAAPRSKVAVFRRPDDGDTRPQTTVTCDRPIDTIAGLSTLPLVVELVGNDYLGRERRRRMMKESRHRSRWRRRLDCGGNRYLGLGINDPLRQHDSLGELTPRVSALAPARKRTTASTRVRA